MPGRSTVVKQTRQVNDLMPVYLSWPLFASPSDQSMSAMRRSIDPLSASAFMHDVKMHDAWVMKK